jgi:hypothetical protein
MRPFVTKVLFVITFVAMSTSSAVFAAKSKPDLTSDGLKLGKLMLKNSDSRTLNAKVADFHTNGMCMFEASYRTLNKGKGDVSAKFVNILTRNGKLVRRNQISQLKSGDNQEHKFLLALPSGDNKLELSLDNSSKVEETTEKNNKFVANLNIVGKCSGKARAPKKK